MSILNKQMIFITGASRSGTTMLNRIFGRHTKILGLNELHVFGDLIEPDRMLDKVEARKQTDLCETILLREQYNVYHANKKFENEDLLKRICEKVTADSSAAEIFMETITALTEQAKKTIACEQTPRNIFYAQQILDIYPNAHIVHIVRDPRSVLASQKSKWRLKFLDGDHIPWLDIIRMWCNYHPITLSKLWMEANRTASYLSDHPRVQLIKFEDLLTSPDDVIAKLCTKMGLEFESTMLDITHEGSSHQINAGEERGISNSTQANWKKSLSTAEIHLSQRMCAEGMEYYSYENVENTLSLVEIALVWFRFPVHIIGVALFNPRRAKIQLMSLLNKFKT